MVKAVVLTYDRQVGLAELAVKSYLQFWKECPFQFVIPQNDPNSPDFEFLRRQNNVTMVGTPSSMPQTMSKLLERFEDDAWLYWCIDDRYPISLDVHRLEAIVAFIESGAAESLNAIKLIHWREKPDQGREDIQIGDATFRFQAPVSTWGFWHHHFLKAKVLKNLFLMLPDALAENPRAWNAHLNNLPTIEAFKETVFP